MTKLLLASFLAIALGGCAADASNPASSEDTEGTEDELQSAPGVCIEGLPIEVWSYAAHLELGRPVSQDGAAGSIYYTFGSGSIVRWSNVTQSVSEVHVKAKSGPTAGADTKLQPEVAAAAEANAFGRYLSEDGAAGSIYYTFARGIVRWSNVESKIAEVKRTDGSKAKPKAALTASKTPSDVCLNRVPAAVWSLSTELDLGPAQSEDGAAGSMYYDFGNDNVVRWSNVTSSVSEVTLNKEKLPVAAAQAAAKHGFGSYVSSEGAAGSLYFTFDRGYVRWSNVTSSVSEVTAQ